MSTLRKVIRASRLQDQVDSWNAQNEVGAAVTVTKDNGDEIHTTTRGKAYVLSGHTAVIFLDGISGCYALDRVRAAIKPRPGKKCVPKIVTGKDGARSCSTCGARAATAKTIMLCARTDQLPKG